MIGFWGNFEFEVSSDKIYTFDGFGRKASINVEEQELESKKPSIYIKGEGLEEIGISVKLKSDLGVDVKGEVDGYRAALYAKNPQTFVIGNVPLSQNKWLLTSVDETEVTHDNGGNYINATVGLSFKEHVRGGSKNASKKGTSSKKAKGAVEGGVIDKLDGTRYNPNAETSKSNGAVKNSTVKIPFKVGG